MRRSLVSLVIVCLLLLVALASIGSPLDEEGARRVAAEFLGLSRPALRSADWLPLLMRSGGEGGRLRGGVDYYVFGLDGSSGRGFVVVSGEDVGESVLGYSMDSPFDAAHLPEGFRYWLDVCSAYVGGVRSRFGGRPPRSHSSEQIAPLLGGMAWDQREPYNTHTPRIDGVLPPVGCVATALSQIMRYHCWPDKGKGKVSYSLNSGGSIRETLGTHRYDWSSMPGRYGPSSTKGQREAVARLMYEVGIASEMQYAVKGSGAHSWRGALALRAHFRYSPTLRLSVRGMMPQQEWERMILHELRAERPVYYAGASVGGAHAFVCDGYDGRGYFHFNWGWGGMGNGYFSLLDLDPVVQGAGAGSGSGYIIQQELITGIQPDTVRGAEVALSMSVDSIWAKPGVWAKRDELEVRISRFLSMSVPRVQVEPGVGVYSERGDLVSAFGANEYVELKTYNYLTRFGIGVDLSSLGDGRYRLYPIVRSKDRGWERVHVDVSQPQFVGLEVAGDRVRVMDWVKPRSALRVKLLTPTLRKGSPNRLVFSLRNEGEGEFLGYYSLRLVRGSGGGKPSRDQLMVLSAVHLLPGDEQVKEMIVPIDGAYGVTHLEFRNMEDIELNLSEFDTFVPAHVLDLVPVSLLPPLPFDVETQPACRVLSFSEEVEAGGRIHLSVEVRNPGIQGLHSRFGLFVVGESIRVPSVVDVQAFLLFPGQIDTVHLSAESALKAGAYEALPAIYSESEGKFKLIASGEILDFRVLSSHEELPVKRYSELTPVQLSSWDVAVLAPNPAREETVLRRADGGVLVADWVRLHSLSGREVWRVGRVEVSQLSLYVGHLPAGVYLLQLEQDGEVRSLRLVVNR